MIRLKVIALSLLFCTSVFAEPVMYICERPSWGNAEGCGPNNTRFTYGFLINTERFAQGIDGGGSGAKMWSYVFAENKGCGLDGARGKTAKFRVIDDGFIFGLDHNRVVELHTVSMEAKIHGTAIKHSPYMTCEEVKGEAIAAHPRLGGTNFVTIQPGYVGPSPVAVGAQNNQ